MNRFAHHIIILLLVFGLGFSSCKSTRPAATVPVPESKNEGVRLGTFEKLEFDRLFFEGEKEKLIGNYAKALQQFEGALAIDPQNAAARYEVSTLQFNSRRFKQAEENAKKAVHLSPNNKWYSLLLADIYQNQSRMAEAAQVYESLITRNKEPDYFFTLAGLYLADNKINDALRTLDKMEKEFGPLEEVITQKHKIYYEQKEYEKAATEIRKLIAANPGDIRFLQILAQTYLQGNQDDKAFQVLREMEQLDSTNGILQLSMAQYYYKKGDTMQSFALLKKAFRNPDLNIDGKIQILFTNYLSSPTVGDRALREAVILSENLVAAHPKDAKSYAMYGDFLSMAKKNKEARDAYRTSISIRNNVFAVWQQLLLIDSDLRDFEGLANDSRKAMELFPSQPVVFFFHGIAQIELKKFKDAIESLQTGLSLLAGNVGLEGQFYINLAEASYRLNKFKESDDYFEKAIALDDSNALALNNYAYYLSIRGEKLERAEQMSKRTLVLDPTNPSYMDTYGWILFKLGKYTDAEKHIKNAIEADRESAEVLEHYGDVLFKLGRAEEAVEYWKKAKAAGSDSNQLELKINQRRLPEP